MRSLDGENDLTASRRGWVCSDIYSFRAWEFVAPGIETDCFVLLGVYEHR